MNILKKAAEVVAFQAECAPFTVRRGLEAMQADPILQSECPDIFGMPFADLVVGMTEFVDLDVEYESFSL